MDPNIYLNATVFSRLAQRDQKLKLQAVPEPEFKPFDLAYLTNAPAKRGQSRNTSRNGEAQHNLYLTPSRPKGVSVAFVLAVSRAMKSQMPINKKSYLQLLVLAPAAVQAHGSKLRLA